MKFDINIFIITCTALVSIVGLCVVVWSFITTRLIPKSATGEFLDELLNVPDNPTPTPAPKRKIPGIVVEIEAPGLSEKDVKDFEVGVYCEKFKISVGSIWISHIEEGNPFDSPIKIVVLDIQNGFVKYEPPPLYKDSFKSCSLESFVNRYNPTGEMYNGS